MKKTAVLREAQNCWAVYVGDNLIPSLVYPRKPRFTPIGTPGGLTKEKPISIEPITILRGPSRPTSKKRA